MFEVFVGRDENLEPLLFRHIEQVSVCQGCPAALICGRDFVMG